MALGLAALPFLPIEQPLRALLWAGMTAGSLLSALVLLLHWRSSDQQGTAPNAASSAGRDRHARRGRQERDRLTGLYARDVWMQAIGRRLDRWFRRPTPVSLMVLRLEGNLDLAGGNELLRQLGLELLDNVRPNDLCARLGDRQLAVALARCPLECAPEVADRVAHSLHRLVSPGEGGADLRLRWAAATLPDQAGSPAELLRVACKGLDRGTGRPMLTTG